MLQMPVGCVVYLRGSHSVRLQPRETWNRNMKMFLLMADSRVRCCRYWRGVRGVGELRAAPLFSNTRQISQSHERSRMLPEWFWKPSYVLEEYQVQPRSRTLPEAYGRFQKFPEGFQKIHTFYVDVPVNLDLACFRNISRTREYMPRRDGFFSTATQTSCCNRIQRSNRVRLLVVSTHDFPDTPHLYDPRKAPDPIKLQIQLRCP